MSMITSVFHTYGFLITDDAANRILQYVKNTSPALYERFSDSESELSFQEYLSEEYDGCQYGTADYMTVWRIKDREELDLNPGDQFISWSLNISPSYSLRLMPLMRKSFENCRKNSAIYCLRIFHLITILLKSWGKFGDNGKEQRYGFDCASFPHFFIGRPADFWYNRGKWRQ